MCADFIEIALEMAGKVISALTDMGVANFYTFIKDLPYDSLIDAIFGLIG